MSLRTFRRYSELRLTMLQGCFCGLHWGPVYDVSHVDLFPRFQPCRQRCREQSYTSLPGHTARVSLECASKGRIARCARL